MQLRQAGYEHPALGILIKHQEFIFTLVLNIGTLQVSVVVIFKIAQQVICLLPCETLCNNALHVRVLLNYRRCPLLCIRSSRRGKERLERGLEPHCTIAAISVEDILIVVRLCLGHVCPVTSWNLLERGMFGSALS